MTTARVIARNILSTWAAFGVQVAITFLLTPFVLRSLGDARYGIWALITGITGYYGVLDIGFRAGLTQFLARYHAQQRMDRLNAAASTGATVLSICGVFLTLISFLIAYLAPKIFIIPPDMVADARWCIVLVGTAISLQFFFFVYSAVFTAMQRYDLSSAIGIGTQLLSALAIWRFLVNGGGLRSLATTILLANTVDYAMRTILARRMLPKLRVNFHGFDWSEFRQLFSFSAGNVLIGLSQRIISYTDVLVIGVFMPPAAIAHYALAANLALYFSSFLTPVSMVFFPEFARRDAISDDRGLTRLFLRGSRLLAGVSLSAGALAYFWCDDFYRLWIGEAYLNSPVYPSVAALFRVLLVSQVIYFTQGIGRQCLLGRRRIGALARLATIEAGLNLGLSVVLIHYFGLLGVALGTALSCALLNGMAFPLMVLRDRGVPGSQYMREVVLRPLICGAMLVLIFAATEKYVVGSGWPAFFISLAGGTMIAALALLLIVGTARERAQLLNWANSIAPWRYWKASGTVDKE